MNRINKELPETTLLINQLVEFNRNCGVGTPMPRARINTAKSELNSIVIANSIYKLIIIVLAIAVIVTNL